MKIVSKTMAETFIADPLMTDQEIEQGVSKDTRFFILFDHYNLPPTGGTQVKEYLAGKTATIDKLIQNYPDCLFILQILTKISKNSSNVMYLPATWIDSTLNPANNTIEIDWSSKRPTTCNHVGGKPRLSRILTNFWLAKNFPSNQLIYTNKEDCSLTWVLDVINHSPYANKSHLHPKKFLKTNWQKFDRNQQTPRIEMYKKILPDMKLKTYISIQTDSNDAYLSSHLSEKFFQSVLGATMPLHLGNWQIDKVLQQMGLETFDMVFDNLHLNSEDLYYLTIGGLENNKNFITDHLAVEELWMKNIGKIQHNYFLAKDSQHWLEKYHKELKILENSLRLSTGGGPFCGHCENLIRRFGYDKMISHQVDKKFL